MSYYFMSIKFDGYPWLDEYFEIEGNFQFKQRLNKLKQEWKKKYGKSKEDGQKN